MLKYVVLGCMVLSAAFAEAPIHGVKPTNVLGTSDQHASFSFVRPGLTQTAFAFSGPSSHQSFSSSVGNPYLAQRVLPNVANALAYRNPGLGVFPVGPIANGYATAPVAPTYVSAAAASAPYPYQAAAAAPAPYPYQAAADPATLAYYQQLQQAQQPQVQGYSAAALYQAQLAQLLALRQAQAQSQVQAQAVQAQQVPEQAELQQEEQQQLQQQEQQPQSLLGVAYSSAPSVARVKVSGNGYKFDF